MMVESFVGRCKSNAARVKTDDARERYGLWIYDDLRIQEYGSEQSRH